MNRWDAYNKMLLELYEKSSHLVTVSIDYHAAIERLRLDGLVFSVIKEETTMFGGETPPVYDKYTLYGITPSGIELISSLPADYAGRPYDYFLKLKEDSSKAESDFKELINKVNRSTIETTQWTRRMYIATLVIAIGTAALALYPLIPTSDKGQLKRQIESIEKRLQELQEKTNQSTHPSYPGQRRRTSSDSSIPVPTGK